MLKTCVPDHHNVLRLDAIRLHVKNDICIDDHRSNVLKSLVSKRYSSNIKVRWWNMPGSMMSLSLIFARYFWINDQWANALKTCVPDVPNRCSSNIEARCGRCRCRCTSNLSPAGPLSTFLTNTHQKYTFKREEIHLSKRKKYKNEKIYLSPAGPLSTFLTKTHQK